MHGEKAERCERMHASSLSSSSSSDRSAMGSAPALAAAMRAPFEAFAADSRVSSSPTTRRPVLTYNTRLSYSAHLSYKSHLAYNTHTCRTSQRLRARQDGALAMERTARRRFRRDGRRRGDGWSRHRIDRCRCRCRPGPLHTDAAQAHMRRDYARSRHICAGTALVPATSAPTLHLRRDWTHPRHICAGTAADRPSHGRHGISLTLRSAGY